MRKGLDLKGKDARIALINELASIMIPRIIISTILTLNQFISFAQTDSMSFGDEGLIVIWDSSKTNSFITLFHDNPYPAIWSNPDLMMDRWIIDSSNRLISRMINNKYGFTYYEWHNNGLIKVENIKIRPYHLEFSTYLNSNGQNRGIENEGGFPFFTTYHDSGNCIKSVYIEIPKDSLSEEMESDFLNSKLIGEFTEFFVAFYFNVDGYLIEKGYYAKNLTIRNQALRTYDKIGRWEFYDPKGNFLNFKEYHIKQ